MTGSTSPQAIPQLDCDLIEDDAIRHPYPICGQIREQAAAVRLPQHQIYAVGGYADVRNALKSWQVFTSARGVAFYDLANEGSRGTTLASDPPLRDRVWPIIAPPLFPSAACHGPLRVSL